VRCGTTKSTPTQGAKGLLSGHNTIRLNVVNDVIPLEGIELVRCKGCREARQDGEPIGDMTAGFIDLSCIRLYLLRCRGTFEDDDESSDFCHLSRWLVVRMRVLVVVKVGGGAGAGGGVTGDRGRHG